MKVWHKTLAVFVAASLAMAQGTAAQAANIDSLKNKQAEIQSNIQAAQGKLSATQKERASTLNALESINKNLGETQEAIRGLRADIATKETDIAALEARIQETQAKYNKQKKAFEKRLVEIYKRGDVKLVDVVFGAESLNDLMTRFQYWQYITESDKALMDEINATKKSLETDQQKLAEARNALKAAEAEKESQSAALTAQQKEKETLVQNLNLTEAQLQQTIQSMQDASASIGAQIAQLQAQAAAQRAAQGAVLVHPNGSGMVIPAPATYGVTSPYGWRSSPFGGVSEFHLGVDLGAAAGTPVVAAQSGTVIIAQYHWSYGNYIVVDHGNGLSTLYAHMSGFTASPGMQVQAGQQIGYIGTTGMSTGPHLHFEVRINGQTTNPQAYIPI